MSVEVTYTVYCDQCGAWGAECTTFMEARRIATEDGWQEQDEDDYCPDCWAKKQEKAGKEKGE